MTIRSNKEYDQHAHDQPTQATDWAAEHQADVTRAAMRDAAGAAPWHQSYNAHAARPATPPSGPFPDYGSLDASIRRGYSPGDSDADREHNVALSKAHMAANEPEMREHDPSSIRRDVRALGFRVAQ